MDQSYAWPNNSTISLNLVIIIIIISLFCSVYTNSLTLSVILLF